MLGRFFLTWITHLKKYKQKQNLFNYEKKQTAVEWLAEILNNKAQLSEFEKGVIEQAKEMEREQIIDAYSEGDVNGIMNNEMRAKQYYNETFNK